MIVQNALPLLKRLLKPAKLSPPSLGLVVRCVAAFCLHWGRMNTVQAAAAVRCEPRHRAQIGRFLAKAQWRRRSPLAVAQAKLLALESSGGRYVFIVDQTCCSQQGTKTENTFSTGNRVRRPCKGRRHGRRKLAPKRCHGFVAGLLLTPSGLRVPFYRCYYTKDYCKARGRDHLTQTQLAAQLIDELPLPAGADVVVLGDTAFDAEVIHKACAKRKWTWIVPVNPERVCAGVKPRPKVRSLVKDLTAEQLQAIRLDPTAGTYVAMRRLSASRIGPRVKPRVYYAHQEKRDVHSVGSVRLVFSTRDKPISGQSVEVQKILMTNGDSDAQEVIELYALRWQIELFFKELKSTLGFDQYRFRGFAAVEGWVEMAWTAFAYLEWTRGLELSRSDLSAKEVKRWQSQRTHGLCVTMRRLAERADLNYMRKALQTRSGVRRLRRLLDNGTQAEYRTAI